MIRFKGGLGLGQSRSRVGSIITYVTTCRCLLKGS